MGKWTHYLCDECWLQLKMDYPPVRLKYPDPQACCNCGTVSESGIFVRQDPLTLACKGVHD